jgi:hypothetical protein
MQFLHMRLYAHTPVTIPPPCVRAHSGRQHRGAPAARRGAGGAAGALEEGGRQAFWAPLHLHHPPTPPTLPPIPGLNSTTPNTPPPPQELARGLQAASKGIKRGSAAARLAAAQVRPLPVWFPQRWSCGSVVGWSAAQVRPLPVWFPQLLCGVVVGEICGPWRINAGGSAASLAVAQVRPLPVISFHGRMVLWLVGFVGPPCTVSTVLWPMGVR